MTKNLDEVYIVNSLPRMAALLRTLDLLQGPIMRLEVHNAHLGPTKYESWKVEVL